MIKYNKNDYNEGRERVSGDLAFQLLSEALRKNDIITDDKVCKHVLMNFISSLAHRLYEEPEQYLDLGNFVIYRDTNLHNLLTIQAKDGENAETVKRYYDRGGLYSEEIEGMVTEFVQNLSATAFEEQQKAINKVNELTELSSKAQKSRNKRTKENNHGV